MHPTEEEIGGLIDQEIEEDQANLLLEHFKECKKCAHCYHQLSAIHSRLTQTAMPESSRKFVDGVMSRLNPVTQEKSPGWLCWLSEWLMPASGIALSFFLLINQPFAENYSTAESSKMRSLILAGIIDNNSKNLFGFNTLLRFQEE